LQDRIRRIRTLLQSEETDAVLVSRPENIYYLTGFNGSSGSVLITETDVCLFTDFRYEQQAKDQSPHCRLMIIKNSILSILKELTATHSIKTLGCEGDFISHLQYINLQESLPDCKIKPLTGCVEKIRIIKDSGEIEKISAAVNVTDQAFNHVLSFIDSGVPEHDLALEIEYFMKKNGAEGIAFPFIVASGKRSSMPHGTASKKLLAGGDLLTMDIGATMAAYNSDLTRTVAIQKAGEKCREIYKIVLEAQMAGIDSVRSGIPACDADRAARKIIEKHGYGEFFGHGTGHGVGLQIHESPRLSAGDHTILEPGMVVTVEPGIYLPGWGGIRIEDTVAVTENGCRVLSSSYKKDLMICGNK